jgi:hypothetical protein
MRVFAAVQAAVGVELRLVEEESGPNPDDRGLYRLEATSALGTEDIREAVFPALRLGTRLAHWWQVTGPHEDELGQWTFTALSHGQRLRVPGVEAAGLEISGKCRDAPRVAT